MKCDVVHFTMPLYPYDANSPSRTYVQCNTHLVTDFAPYYHKDMLCPVGKIEQAVEDGLEKIRKALNDTKG